MCIYVQLLKLSKDTTIAHILPLWIPLIHVRNFQVNKRHSLFISDTLLQVELHQGQHLCEQRNTSETQMESSLANTTNDVIVSLTIR